MQPAPCHRASTDPHHERADRTRAGSGRVLALLAFPFGVLAVALAAVVSTACCHAGRAAPNEIGIRIALSARRRQVLWVVMRDAVWILALGVGSAFRCRGSCRGWQPRSCSACPRMTRRRWQNGGILLVVGLAAGVMPRPRRASQVIQSWPFGASNEQSSAGSITPSARLSVTRVAASIGSMRDARRAGRYPARRDAAASGAAAVAKTLGSDGVTPKSIDEARRVSVAPQHSRGQAARA